MGVWNILSFTPQEKSNASPIVSQRAIKLLQKNTEIHTIKAKALTDLCNIPEKGEQYRIVTEKQFNAFAVILAILEKEDIEDMYLAIYRINEATVDSLINIIESGRIRSATFIISNFFNQTKRPEKWAIRLRDYASTRSCVRHVYVHNHSKVLCVNTTKGNHYVFEGSGNMSDNARIEQYLYENNVITYNFHKDWMVELVEKHGGVK